MANLAFPTFPYGEPPIAPVWGGPPPLGGPPPGGPPPFGGPGMVFAGPPPDQPTEEFVGMLTNSKRNQVADVRVQPGASLAGAALAQSWKASPIADTQMNNNSGVIELSMLEYLWTINPMNIDPNGVNNSPMGQTMTISTRVSGVDRYWTLDETRGQ
ncbi:hypothetical protein FB451DRAFT_1285736, partial [Mycena latifolia]